MNSCAVEANGPENIGLKGCSKCEMSADAKSSHSELPFRHARMLMKVIEHRSGILIKIRDSRLRCASHSSVPPFVIERNDRSCRFDSMINLGRGYYKTVARKAHA